MLYSSLHETLFIKIHLHSLATLMTDIKILSQEKSSYTSTLLAPCSSSYDYFTAMYLLSLVSSVYTTTKIRTEIQTILKRDCYAMQKWCFKYKQFEWLMHT